MRLPSKLTAAAVAALTLVLAPVALSVVPPKGGEAVKSKYTTESLLLGPASVSRTWSATCLGSTRFRSTPTANG